MAVAPKPKPKRQRSIGRVSMAILLIVVFALLSTIRNVRLLNDIQYRNEEEDLVLPRALNDNAWSNITSLRLSRQQQQGPTTTRRETSFSACLLLTTTTAIDDDNNNNLFFAEWLAYHYHTLPLRRLIVATTTTVSPSSKTTVLRDERHLILERWRRHGMVIDEWKDGDFMPPNAQDLARKDAHSDVITDDDKTDDSSLLHHFRQRVFFSKCARRIKAENYTWTMFLDTDEYLTLNHRKINNNNMTRAFPREPGSILSFLRRTTTTTTTNETDLSSSQPCIMIPRLDFGGVVHHDRADSTQPTPQLSALLSSLTTTARREHGSSALHHDLSSAKAKSIIDVSRIPSSRIVVSTDPHRLVGNFCPDTTAHVADSDLIIHRYSNARGQQDDGVRNVSVGKVRNQSQDEFDMYNDIIAAQDTSIRLWFGGFVESEGIENATRLMGGTSETALLTAMQNRTPGQRHSVALSKEGGYIKKAVGILDLLKDPRSVFRPKQAAGGMNLSSEPKTARDVVSTADTDAFSACLLVMDDNHILIEWIAYHYHVLPLRHLIVAVDPRSVTSPSEILDRWRHHGMTIEEWSDKDFMSAKLFNVSQHTSELNRTEIILLHRARQKEFYEKCMKRHQKMNRTWTTLIDTDEFLVVNKRATDRFNVDAPSIEQPASVMSFLKQERAKPRNETEMPKHTSCIMIPRLRFGSKASTPEEIAMHVPAGFNASTFTTLRDRKHAGLKQKELNKTGKTIIDVSKLHPGKMKVKNPHRPLWYYCPQGELQTQIEDNLFVIHHYCGTWEQYSFREDYRAMISKKSFEHYNSLNYDDDSIRPWLNGFVQDKGVDMASSFLKGVGAVPRKVTPITTSKNVRVRGSLHTW